MSHKIQLSLGASGSVRGAWPVGVQRQRRRTVTWSGRGPSSSNSADDPLKNLDLKNLNDLPLAKLSETANAVWERIRSSGMNVKVSPSPPGSSLLPPNLVPPGGVSAGVTNGAPPRPNDTSSELAVTERSAGAGKEQRLMAALAQVQEEKQQLADRAELLRANVSMLEAKNARMVREVESAESGRANALRLRDMLLEERDSLAVQLKETQEELQRATAGMEVREGALEALRQSQQQLQEELRDAVSRLQAVDRSTEELRSQLTSLESSRAAAVGERDDLAAHLRELVGRVEQLGDLFSGAEGLGVASPAASTLGTAEAAPSPEAAAAPASASSPPEAISPVAAAAAQLQQLRTTTEGAFAALQAARSELGVLRAENQHLAQRAEALTSSNRELQATTESLKQHLAETRTELDEQRREAAELRGREAALQAELTAAAAAAAQRDELAAAVAQLSAIRDAAAASGLGLVELAKMASQITGLKEQLEASRTTEAALKRSLAAAEVALLDSRREAAATEARLVSELDTVRRDAAELRATLHARSLAAAAARRAGAPLAPGEGHFVNVNRFWVPTDLMFEFIKAVAAREVALVETKGFLNMAVRCEEAQRVTVSTQWESLAAYEAWSRSDAARRHHYPSGAFQFVPRRGEGFPEDYLPFKDLGEPAGAKH